MLAFLPGGGIAAVLLAGAWFAFSGAGMLLSVVYPLGASLLVYGLLVFHNYFHEERERRFVRGAFGQYLAPALGDELARRPERLVLGGATRRSGERRSGEGGGRPGGSRWGAFPLK